MKMTAEYGLGAPDQIGLLRRLRRRKLWLAGTFGLTLAAVAAALFSMPRSYRSSASVVIADNGALVDSSSQAQAARIGDPADLESQMLMLRSTRLFEAVLQREDVRQALLRDCQAARGASWIATLRNRLSPPETSCDQELDDRRAMLERLDGGYAIGTVGRSRVIEIGFTSNLPDVPPVLANALADAYLAQDLARKVDTRAQAADWLRNELDRTGEALRAAEIAVERYRAENGILRGEQSTIVSEQLSALNAQLVQAEAARAIAASRLQGAGDSREVLESRAIADLKQQAAIASGEYAQLAARYGNDHPALTALAQRQSMLQGQIGAERSRILESLRRDRASAEARVADLQRQMEVAKREVGATDGAAAAIATLVRDVEVKRELFVDLSKRLATLETDRRLVAGDSRLVSTAQLPTRAWFPKRGPFLVVGAMLAGILAVVVALLRDRADTRLRSVEGITLRAGVPLLGRVPRIGRRRAPLPLAWRLDQPSGLQDAIRALYARTLLTGGDPRRVLLFASAGPGEGKTFLTLALARFAAAAGRRVLTVECDLRRPGFRSALKLPKGPGLTEYLRGQADLEGIIQPGRDGRPDVIHAGTPAVDSTELLSGEALARLLRLARERYDLVLIDSPPALLMEDARLLSRHADGVVVCAGWGQSQTEAVLRSIEDLREGGAHILGVALGMVKEREYALYAPSATPAAGRYPALSAGA